MTPNKFYELVTINIKTWNEFRLIIFFFQSTEPFLLFFPFALALVGTLTKNSETVDRLSWPT
jgi:hypothetical protein